MGQASRNRENNRILFLDYLRIFAFASVLIGHKFYTDLAAIAADPTLHSSLRAIVGLLLPALYGGGAGVVVFFLVSGYIITHVLQTESVGDFLVKRAFRIYPLYIFTVLAQYIVAPNASQALDLSNLIPQLLLVGDVTGTPYALNGVEWTLRIELAFYVYMAALSWLGILARHRKALPWLYAATALACYFLAPIPSSETWSKGYFTIYAPFLLLGSAIYLAEKKQTSTLSAFLLCSLVLLQYWSLIGIYQKIWLDKNFAIVALGIFVAAWTFRHALKQSLAVVLLSDMTYAIYLFHNWLFDYFETKSAVVGIPLSLRSVISLAMLFAACFLVMIVVERPGIRAGRALLNKLHRPIPNR